MLAASSVVGIKPQKGIGNNAYDYSGSVAICQINTIKKTKNCKQNFREHPQSTHQNHPK